MRGYIFTITLFLFLMIPSAVALDAIPAYSTRCFNSTDLLKEANITDRGDGSKILDSEQYVRCPYGCDQNRDICWKWPGDAISGEYFLLFEMIALLIFFLSLWRTDTKSNDIKLFDVVTPMVGAMLFILLALQGNNVIDMTTGEGIPITMIVWFDYGMSLMMLILFFFNVFKFARSVTDEGNRI